jgi:hypothetical protein
MALNRLAATSDTRRFLGVERTVTQTSDFGRK